VTAGQNLVRQEAQKRDGQLSRLLIILAAIVDAVCSLKPIFVAASSLSPSTELLGRIGTVSTNDAHNAVMAPQDLYSTCKHC